MAAMVMRDMLGLPWQHVKAWRSLLGCTPAREGLLFVFRLPVQGPMGWKRVSMLQELAVKGQRVCYEPTPRAAQPASVHAWSLAWQHGCIRGMVGWARSAGYRMTDSARVCMGEDASVPFHVSVPASYSLRPPSAQPASARSLGLCLIGGRYVVCPYSSNSVLRCHVAGSMHGTGMQTEQHPCHGMAGGHAVSAAGSPITAHVAGCAACARAVSMCWLAGRRAQWAHFGCTAGSPAICT